MNNFTFELLTKCLINDAMVRGVEADVRGAAPAAAAPVPLGSPKTWLSECFVTLLDNNSFFLKTFRPSQSALPTDNQTPPLLHPLL